MTIEREEPNLIVAVCDGCGERRILDIEPEKEDGEIGKGEVADALEEIGWRRDEPERIRFPSDGLRRHGLLYEQDLCGDCQDETPAPKPLFGSGRVARRATVGAFDNDPCDEWPRDLVFAAVGLRTECGHPHGPLFSRCSYCDAGYPIGSTVPAYKR